MVHIRSKIHLNIMTEQVLKFKTLSLGHFDYHGLRNLFPSLFGRLTY